MDASTIQIAIDAIERTFHCNIAISDHEHEIVSLLNTTSIAHFHPACAKIKRDRYLDLKCVEIDISRGYEQAKYINDAFWKVCPMGIMELVSPIILNKQVQGLIFCGAFTPRQDIGKNALIFNRKASTSTDETYTLSDREFHELPALLSILTSQIAFLLKEHQEQPDDSSMQKDIIEDYINKEFRSPIGLPDISARLHLNEAYLSRRIKALFNENFSVIIERKRLENACVLLRKASYKIKNVARNSGFRDLSYFYRKFKKTYGITPLEYRKQYKGK